MRGSVAGQLTCYSLKDLKGRDGNVGRLLHFSHASLIIVLRWADEFGHQIQDRHINEDKGSAPFEVEPSPTSSLLRRPSRCAPPCFLALSEV